MKSSVVGLIFLYSQQSLPSCTFVAADAVNWLISHVDGISNNDKAIQVIIKLF